MLNVCARGSSIKSVSGDNSLLELLGPKPTTRSTTSLCESVSTSESDEAACYSTFLSGGCGGCWHYWIVQHANVHFDHCDLFSFLPFEGDLVMRKVQGWLVHPQGRQLIGVVQSNPVSAIVLPVQRFHSGAPFQSPLSSYSATSFSATLYLSENVLIASLSPLTSLLSSNNHLIWARGAQLPAGVRERSPRSSPGSWG